MVLAGEVGGGRVPLRRLLYDDVLPSPPPPRRSSSAAHEEATGIISSAPHEGNVPFVRDPRTPERANFVSAIVHSLSSGEWCATALRRQCSHLRRHRHPRPCPDEELAPAAERSSQRWRSAARAHDTRGCPAVSRVKAVPSVPPDAAHAPPEQ